MVNCQFSSSVIVANHEDVVCCKNRSGMCMKRRCHGDLTMSSYHSYQWWQEHCYGSVTCCFP